MQPIAGHGNVGFVAVIMHQGQQLGQARQGMVRRPDQVRRGLADPWDDSPDLVNHRRGEISGPAFPPAKILGGPDAGVVYGGASFHITGMIV